MSDGFAYIDILFFAMVAACIALRLRSVLGRRTGHERRRTGGFQGPSSTNGATDPKSASDNVVALPDRSAPVAEADAALADLAEGKVKTGLTQIRFPLPRNRFTRRIPAALP
jgi:predicted lipid-binding transport protein (Tim44 family)